MENNRFATRADLIDKLKELASDSGYEFTVLIWDNWKEIGDPKLDVLIANFEEAYHKLDHYVMKELT